MGVFAYARHSKVTVEKVQAYLHDVDLGKLQGEARARAINELARKINALPVEERREARRDDVWAAWFTNMTEPERIGFLDATLPSGFKQMIESFEKLPEDQRRRAVADAVRRLRESPPERPLGPRGETNGPPPGLTPELQQRFVQHGLRAFYSQSSAQTKAEVAPFLEELQRAMESGRMLRGR